MFWWLVRAVPTSSWLPCESQMSSEVLTLQCLACYNIGPGDFPPGSAGCLLPPAPQV